MANNYDLAKDLATLITDKNKLKAQIAGSAVETQIGKRSTNLINVKVVDVRVKTRTVIGGFYLGSTEFGNLGTNRMESTASNIYTGWTTHVRRLWEYNDYDSLSEGVTDNIDISNGDIRIG